jgi:hypothetical protein
MSNRAASSSLDRLGQKKTLAEENLLAFVGTILI